MPRLFRTVPIARKPVKVFFEIPRVECQACGVRRQVRLGFADPLRHDTRAFAR